jgi:hypothetical protein
LAISLSTYPPPEALSLITRSFNGNTVRNFPTHGQLSAAQGNLTSCLNFDFAILNLFEPSAPYSDGPEVEQGAHFLILYYPEYGFLLYARTHASTHTRTYRYTMVHHYRYAHVHHFRYAHADES